MSLCGGSHTEPQSDDKYEEKKSVVTSVRTDTVQINGFENSRNNNNQNENVTLEFVLAVYVCPSPTRLCVFVHLFVSGTQTS